MEPDISMAITTSMLEVRRVTSVEEADGHGLVA